MRSMLEGASSGAALAVAPTTAEPVLGLAFGETRGRSPLPLRGEERHLSSPPAGEGALIHSSPTGGGGSPAEPARRKGETRDRHRQAPSTASRSPSPCGGGMRPAVIP